MLELHVIDGRDFARWDVTLAVFWFNGGFPNVVGLKLTELKAGEAEGPFKTKGLLNVLAVGATSVTKARYMLNVRRSRAME